MARAGSAEQSGRGTTPVASAEYQVAELEKSERLERMGTERFDLAKDATKHTDSYVLSTVFFAAVLFFAGISIRFGWRPMRITVIVLASISLVYAVVLVARLPTV
jgi:multidrug efflux pump subunit AcrB